LPPPPSSQSNAKDAPLPLDIAALPDDARTRFVEASRSLQAGNRAAALEKARPLFDAYRDVLSVQDLRCKIAMAGSSDWTSTRAECDYLMELSTRKK
jgi:hypothetical protein